MWYSCFIIIYEWKTSFQNLYRYVLTVQKHLKLEELIFVIRVFTISNKLWLFTFNILTKKFLQKSHFTYEKQAYDDWTSPSPLLKTCLIWNSLSWIILWKRKRNKCVTDSNRLFVGNYDYVGFRNKYTGIILHCYYD